MLALSVIGMLKAAEREFGEAGQKAMIQAMVDVGKEMGRQMLEGIDEMPGDMEPIEFISAFASAVTAGLIEGSVPHRAMADTRLTLEAFRHYIGRLAPRDPLGEPESPGESTRNQPG